jgi:hypothetical protein
MSGAGAGAGAHAGAGARAEAAARVAAIAQALAIGAATAEIKAMAEQLVELGLVEDAREGMAYCPYGHAFDRTLTGCPRCGSEPGDAPDSNELRADDSEILGDEDAPAGEETVEPGGEEAAELDMSERVEHLLAEEGINASPDLIDVVTIVAEGELAAQQGALERVKREHGLSEDTLAAVQRALDRLRSTSTAGAHEKTLPGVASAGASAEISIWRDGDELRFSVADHMRHLLPTGRGGTVSIGSVRMSAAKALERARQRRDRLLGLASALAEERRAFFVEPDSGKAEAMLETPLTRKEVARRIRLDEATLSRWCDYPGRRMKRRKGSDPSTERELSTGTGVEVETPHGTYYLAEFFYAPSRLIGGEGLTQESAEELIFRHLDEARTRGETSEDTLKRLAEQEGIEIAPRTLRRYRQRMESVRSGN